MSALLGLITISVFNFSGISATKYMNAVARSIGDVSRTVLVWIIGIIVAASTNYPNYEWEDIGIRSILIQLFGFSILILGNLVNNGLIKLHF